MSIGFLLLKHFLKDQIFSHFSESVNKKDSETDRIIENQNSSL